MPGLSPASIRSRWAAPRRAANAVSKQPIRVTEISPIKARAPGAGHSLARRSGSDKNSFALPLAQDRLQSLGDDALFTLLQRQHRNQNAPIARAADAADLDRRITLHQLARDLCPRVPELRFV